VEQPEVCIYLTLLRDLGETLANLTEIEQQKINAVRQDDLSLLNDCMKQEQVLSLTLRGYEQKRQTILHAQNMDDVPLGSLSAHVPEAYRAEAKQVSESLLRQYQLFNGAFEVAQNTLECNLHQIEKLLHDLGAEPTPASAYHERALDLPPSLRTDFRA